MRLRVEALYVHNAEAKLVSINQWDGGVAPRFYLGRTAEESICRVRTDLPNDLTKELQELCADEPLPDDLTQPPVYEEVYTRLLASHAPIERIWSGPAYLFEESHVPSMFPTGGSEVEPVAINAKNVDLLQGGLEEWIPDVPHRQPFMAIIEDGHAVSVCASVRITNFAHEAGVETLPAYRRKGYAPKVVASWAKAVRRVGAIPFYSTSWENRASQKVAERLGLSMFSTDFSIT